MLEEMYVYFAMPAPAFGIQLVYNDVHEPELVTVIRDGDAVLMPSGYHPIVSVPGIASVFFGRWRHTARWRTGNSAS